MNGPLRLEVELPRYGCDIDPQEFREIVRELKQVMTPHWTDEELLYHLSEAGQYVRAVQSRINCPGLPDFIILRTLQNTRKAQWVGKDE